MVTLKLLLWISFIGGFVWWSNRNIQRGNRPFYLLENGAKGFFFILYGIFIWNTQYELKTLNLLLWCASSWWILFDIAMGLVLHGDPLYIGPSSGWIDRLGTKYPIGYWALKALALFVLVQTTINFYTKFA